MGLELGEFEAVPKTPTGGTCSFKRLSLNAADRAVLDEILFEHPDITAKAIVKVLAAHDVKISYQAVSRHRRGDCHCKDS